MKYLFAFFVVAFLIFETTNGQAVFKNGFIISNEGDTIYGLVDYRGEIRNMKVCNFKINKESEVKTYLPGSINGYRYTDGKYYVSKFIKTEFVTDTVYVEFLLSGISNLYYYKTNNYLAYFIESKDGELLEIRKDDIEVEKDGHVFLKKDKKYLGYLKYAFEDCPEIHREIENVQVGHKSLIEITKRYHDYMCEDEQCIVYEKKLPVLRVQILPFIGFTSNSYEFEGGEFDKYSFDTSSSMVGGVGFNFIIPRFNEKLSLYTNFQFSKSSFSDSDVNDLGYLNDYYEVQLKSTRLLVDAGFQYTYPKGAVRPILALGVVKDWSLDEESYLINEKVWDYYGTPDSRTEEAIEGLSKSKFGYAAHVGVVWKIKSLDFFLKASYISTSASSKYDNGKFAEKMPDIKEKSKTYQVSAGIVF